MDEGFRPFDFMQHAVVPGDPDADTHVSCLREADVSGERFCRQPGHQPVLSGSGRRTRLHRGSLADEKQQGDRAIGAVHRRDFQRGLLLGRTYCLVFVFSRSRRHRLWHGQHRVSDGRVQRHSRPANRGRDGLLRPFHQSGDGARPPDWAWHSAIVRNWPDAVDARAARGSDFSVGAHDPLLQLAHGASNPGSTRQRGCPLF